MLSNFEAYISPRVARSDLEWWHGRLEEVYFICVAVEKPSARLDKDFLVQPFVGGVSTPLQATPPLCSVIKPSKLIHSPEWTLSDLHLGLSLESQEEGYTLFMSPPWKDILAAVDCAVSPWSQKGLLRSEYLIQTNSTCPAERKDSPFRCLQE